MKTTLFLHQTHHTLADFDQIFESTLDVLKNPQEKSLHIFPELFLTGYPLQDLLLQKSFINSYQNHLDKLEHWAQKQSGNWRALLGGIFYSLQENGLPLKIKNVIYELSPGKGLKVIYAKRLLPNYDIFDELKYFSPGESNAFYEFNGNIFGLQICEDMWASSIHQIDPCELMLEEVTAKNLKIDGIINLSASPFEAAKKNRRINRAKNISLQFNCPFIYVNRVGGEDEILFDGGSFVVSQGEVTIKMMSFVAETKEFIIEGENKNLVLEKFSSFQKENTWEELFSPKIDAGYTPARLKEWTDDECSEVLKALIFGLQEYANKNGFKNFLVALSGGIDSAVVLAIVKLALRKNQSVEAIYMPGLYSSSDSTTLAQNMCQKLNIPLSYLPIKFLHATVKNTFLQCFSSPFEGVVDENVQSRLRGLLLYTRSNQTEAMVINTSNKSELAVGYSTQYGDSVGALSLLGDLYKSEVFRMAKYINSHHGNLIPEGIINRGPSAELRANQLDQDSLPPYVRLDPILEGILSFRLGKKELLKLGFDENEIKRVLYLYSRSEYKRVQFCPILKVKVKSFGFGYRIPISKNNDFQFNS